MEKWSLIMQWSIKPLIACSLWESKGLSLTLSFKCYAVSSEIEGPLEAYLATPCRDRGGAGPERTNKRPRCRFGALMAVNTAFQESRKWSAWRKNASFALIARPWDLASSDSGVGKHWCKYLNCSSFLTLYRSGILFLEEMSEIAQWLPSQAIKETGDIITGKCSWGASHF